MYKFFKMNGLGNSFIFFDESREDFSLFKKKEILEILCHSGDGIGADGVVFVKLASENEDYDCSMQIFNADGSEAEMCGNALRCVAHLYIAQKISRNTILVKTKTGIKSVALIRKSEDTNLYRAQLGQPNFDLVATGELLPENQRTPIIIENLLFEPIYVNVGNPHMLLFFKQMPDIKTIKQLGEHFETHANHPKRINIEFVEVSDSGLCNIQIWERGCGITKACGTGASAVVAAGIKQKLFDLKVMVQMSGGVLEIEQEADGCLYMTGPVQEVVYGHLSGVFVNKLLSL